MATFAEKCVLAALGYAALTNYQAHVADAYAARQEQHRVRGDRTEALIIRWRELRPNAEVAAQFYRADEPTSDTRRRRRGGNTLQRQFFEEQFFSTVNFWRIAGGDVALGRVNAGELSAYVGGDARTWLTLLRQQPRGRWDEIRQGQIEQAIMALELIVNQGGKITNTSAWRRLDIDCVQLGERRGAEIDITAVITNSNDADSPVAPLAIVALVAGTVIVRWPKLFRIRGHEAAIVAVSIPLSHGKAGIDVRFAHSYEVLFDTRE